MRRRADVDCARLIKGFGRGLYEEFRPAKIAIRASLARTALMISLEREMHTYEVRPRESTAETQPKLLFVRYQRIKPLHDCS